MAVIDIQAITKGASTSVVVLHSGDLDKLVGTKARHPVCRLGLFEMQGHKLVPVGSVDALN